MAAAFRCSHCGQSPAVRMANGQWLCRAHHELYGFTSPAEHVPEVQQLVARIKRSSKYWGQTAPNEWFDVRVVEDTHYHLRGNNNNYRLSDVACGMRLASGAVVDFAKGGIGK